MTRYEGESISLRQGLQRADLYSPQIQFVSGFSTACIVLFATCLHVELIDGNRPHLANQTRSQQGALPVTVPVTVHCGLLPLLQLITPHTEFHKYSKMYCKTRFFSRALYFASLTSLRK